MMNTVELARIYSAMQDILNIPLIFPINDTASAILMLIKAECLHKAGVISEGEKQWVESRARIFLNATTLSLSALLNKDEARLPSGASLNQ
jgi:hypothetical protein